MHCKEELTAGCALRKFLMLFGTLIHSRCIKTRHPALGQISIDRVGQYSVGLNSQVTRRPSKPAKRTI